MKPLKLLAITFSPLSWLLKRLRGPYRSVLDTAKPKLKAQALAWAAAHYPDEHLQKIAARFILLLEIVSCVPIKQFTPHTRFLEDLKMDDLEPVELLMALEEEFPIVFIEKDAEKLQTIDGVIRYIATAKSPPVLVAR
jgi:acyl carrier protein